MPRLILILSLVAATPACALGLRNPNISDVQHNPARYQNRTVYIDGVVTTAWGTPFVPLRFYRVTDGTGELTVLSQGVRTPTRGARVRVKGRLHDVAVLNGAPVGLHLKEEDLKIRR